MHELYRSPDPAAQWVDNDLTAFAHGTPAPAPVHSMGTRKATAASTSISSTTNGHVHELYRSPDPAAQWVDNDLTAFARGNPGRRRPSRSMGTRKSDGSQHVNFIDANGHVHELYRSPDPAAQWVDNDLTALAQRNPGRLRQSAHSMGTRKATAASTSISSTTTGTFTSCTGARIRRPSGWTTT